MAAARFASAARARSADEESPAASAGGELPRRRKSDASTAPESPERAAAARTSRSSSRSRASGATGTLVRTRGVNPPTTARRLRNKREESP